MPSTTQPIVSFAGGEFGLALSARVDLQKRTTGCIQLRNMLAWKTGAASRRMGTEFKAVAKKDIEYAVRVEDFQYSLNTSFTLEFGHHYVRFYSNGQQVEVSSAPAWIYNHLYLPGDYVTDPTDNLIYYCYEAVQSGFEPHTEPNKWSQQTILEVPTPYDAAVGAGDYWETDIFGLQFCQINDVVYICHKAYPRAKLVRLADTEWTYQAVQDIVPPLLDQNATDTTIAASSTNNIGDIGTILRVDLTNPGTGYVSAPTVSFIGGGGSGAAATAVVGGAVVGVNVNNEGDGYYYPPDITFSGGGGTGASAYGIVASGYLVAIVITNPGSGYASAPAVGISGGGGSGASATANISASGITAIVLTNPGSGYTSPPTVQILGGSGIGATATASLGGVITLTASAPPWTTGIYYDFGNSVLQDGVIYECREPHVSEVFADDLASGYWVATPIFQAGHVGSYWELAYRRGSSQLEYLGVAATGFANGFSEALLAFGPWTVLTYGVWNADVVLQSSVNGGVTWQNELSLSSRDDANFNQAGVTTIARLYRFQVKNNTTPGTAGATDPRLVFICSDSFLTGIVKITAVLGDYTAQAAVITQLAQADAWVTGTNYTVGDRVSYNGINYIAVITAVSSTAPNADAAQWSADGWPTTYWSEGAWSDVRGYPAAITAWGQRVWCGFTEYQPQRIWGSAIDDIENWDLGDGTLAADGLAFDLDAVGDGAILWLASQDALFIGFSLAEWVLTASDGSAAVTATSVVAHRQSKFGSNQNLPALVVGDALIFAQRQGRKLRQMLFSIVTNKYMSQDLTALSDTVLNLGAVQLAYQKIGQKNGFLWAVTKNGELAVMTYELDQEIFGWSRQFTGLGQDAGFESVCTIQGKGDDDDEVWVVVNRTIGGVRKRYIERFDPTDWQSLISQPGQTPGVGADKNKANHVDSGVEYIDPVDQTFAGLAHLEGRTVRVSINAMDYGEKVVAGGQVTVDEFSPGDFTGEITAYIGLSYKSVVQPMNLDSTAGGGSTLGLIKKVNALYVWFLNSLACKMMSGIPIRITNAGSFITGNLYTITKVGTTDFTLIGATSNTLGVEFTATGPGTGNGNAGSQYQVNDLIARDPNDPFAEPQLVTGIKPFKDFGGGSDYTIPIILFTDGPLPLTVLGMGVDYTVSGKP